MTTIDGACIGIQGDTGTGKSELAARSAHAGRVATFVDLDYNTQYVERRANERHRLDPEDGMVSFHRLGLKPDAVLADRQAQLREINKLWINFITAQPDPRWGKVPDIFIWDTATALWDFIYPLKLDERVAAGLKTSGQLDYKDANAWMRSVAANRLLHRPDALVIFLMHEQPLWVPNPENPKTRIPDPNGGVIPDGWRDLPKFLQLHLRLLRVKQGKDRNGVAKNNVRTGEWLKVSDDESYITGQKIRFSEPEWSDLEGMLEV